MLVVTECRRLVEAKDNARKVRTVEITKGFVFFIRELSFFYEVMEELTEEF